MPNINPWIIGLAFWLIVFLLLVAVMALFQRLVAESKSKEQEIATKEKQQKGNIQSEIAKLKNTIDSVEPITPQHIEKCDRWRDDDFTPIAIRELLPEHIRNVQGYNKWLEESKEIIRHERAVIFQKPKYRNLSDRFTEFRKGDFDSIVLGGMYVYLILDGSVNVANCEDFMYQHYGRSCKAKNNRDTLRDFLASGDFYSFVKLLEEIQKRPSIETFREAREKTLAIIDQIEKALNTKSRKGESVNE